jgi:hypothetical protein
MKIKNYFRQAWTEEVPDPLYKELAELARGCAREGYITLMLLRRPQRCICCNSNDNLCPIRIPVGEKQVVSLLCLRCQKRVSDVKMLAQMIYEVRSGIRNAESHMEMALLFQSGQRIRMVTGYKLESEVLS